MYASWISSLLEQRVPAKCAGSADDIYKRMPVDLQNTRPPTAATLSLKTGLRHILPFQVARPRKPRVPRLGNCSADTGGGLASLWPFTSKYGSYARYQSGSV